VVSRGLSTRRQVRSAYLDGYVIELNLHKHADRNLAAAHVFSEWLVSLAGQAAIGAYRVSGEQLFNPSAADPK
jgi:ABC-type tungstate transport system permease subunit